jgi:hypothetical protein
VIGLLLLTSCVSAPSISPEDCQTPTRALTARLPADGPLDPSQLVACVGQHVTLTVSAERDGVLHIHGLEGTAAAAEAHAGQTLELDVEAATAGQFLIELHTSDQPNGIEVGILTVY